MSRRNQLLVILLTVLSATSAFSHLIAWKFKILTNAGQKLHFGKFEDSPTAAFAAGSSLAFYGIAWNDISDGIEKNIEGYAVPGASVREMEIFYRQHPRATPTFIAISAYDINEHHISDYRAQVVPFREEIHNLWAAKASWSHSKKVLSQYPMRMIQAIFPTAGAYGAVMVRTREILRGLFRRNAPAVIKPSSDAAVITDKGNNQTSTIADWTDAHMQRSIVEISSHGGGTFEFASTKREALLRFIRQGETQGKVVILVFPESPAYNASFLNSETRRQFENLLADARSQAREATWVRLDQIPELNSNQYFWDLVHMNAQGQAIATKILLAQLQAAGIAR